MIEVRDQDDWQRAQLPALQIDFSKLRHVGLDNDDDPESRLFGSIEINGVGFHVEAIQLDFDETDHQDAVGSMQMRQQFAEFYEACGGCGPMATIEFEGREYALFIYPHCD